MMYFIYSLLGILTILSAGCTASYDLSGHTQQQTIIIGTGGSTGMYFPTGKAICRIVNKETRNHGINCVARTTKGSLDNLKALGNEDLQFGIARSEWIYQAFRGINKWEKAPQDKLRTVFSIHSESVHLLADSDMKNIQSLRRENLNIGYGGWTGEIDALAVLDAFKIDRIKINGFASKINVVVDLFQKGKLDACLITTGDPGGYTHRTSKARNTYIIPLEGREIDELINKKPYYSKTVIPIHWYPKLKNKQDVPSFGYKTIFFTSADASEEVVYSITREVFNNFEKFKDQHLAYEELTKKNMVEILDKLAPIHPGALRYYKEVGLNSNTLSEIGGGKIVGNYYINKKKGYKIAIPHQEWVAKPVNILDVKFDSKRGGFMGLGAFTMPKSFQFKDVNNWWVKVISEKWGWSDVKIVDEKDLTIAGHNAKVVVFEFTNGNRRFVDMTYHIRKSAGTYNLYRVRMTCVKGKFEEFIEEFKSFANSFSFL